MTDFKAATRRMAKMRKPRNIVEAEKKYAGYRPLGGAELQARIMGFMVQEQGIEDMTRPQQNSATSFPLPLPLPLAHAPVAHAPVDISSPQQTQDVDVDMDVDMDMRTDAPPPLTNTPLPVDPALTQTTDTLMDALMNGMGSMDLNLAVPRQRQRRGAMGEASNMPFSPRQRC